MKLQERNSMRELSADELKVRLRECEEKLMQLRLVNAVSRLKNGLEIRNIRRHRARLITWISQREVQKV